MTAIECFFLKPSNFAEETLRRYSSSRCTGRLGYHNCIVILGVVPFERTDLDGEPGRGIELGDPRWPTKCESCNYEFNEDDEWQHQLTRLYWRSDHLALRTTLDKAPPGSMYYADWYDWKGPDGHCLVLVTPAGPWIIDGPSRNADGSRGFPWTRTGDIPKVTANPSIHFPGEYHGWLRNGILEEC